MTVIGMTFARFEEILPKICKRDTSFDPNGWTEDNPFWGHCVVVSLLAQSLFGGGILGVNLKDTKFAKMKFHVWNQFPNGTEWDFTRSQFGDEYPGEIQIKSFEISTLLSYPDTQMRFNWLKEEFEFECNKNG